MRRLAAILAAPALLLAVLVPMALASPPALVYSAHVSSLGWLPDVASPATAGTTGQSRQMEALRISGGTLAGDIEYRAHVANIGWMAWVGPAFTAGTTGQARQLEAVQVRLSGASALTYSVECRAHVANIGWLPWVRDGATCGTTGQGRRAEAVQLRLVARTTTTTPPTGATALAFTADTGYEATGAAVLASIGASGLPAVIVGDLAYQPNVESAWCSWVKARLTAPVQLIPGNHEAQDGDGIFARYAACLPDRLGVTNGSYSGGQWILDRGSVRVISITPQLALDGATRTYATGTPERAWLTQAIRDGRTAGKWVIVAMHEPCLTLGVHGCASGVSLTDLLITERVDLIVAGHDHIYARTHQLASRSTTADGDGSFAAGAGTVQVIVGNGGHNPRALTAPVAGIWATGAAGSATGWLRVDATPTSLTARVVPVAGSLADAFTIGR